LTGNLPLVSIITLNYNQAALTLQCLQSLQGISYPNIEIIVCDMNSTEQQRAMLESSGYTNVNWYFSPVNLGFAGGNNWGASKSKGEFLLFINNDTVVEPSLVTVLLNRLQGSTQIGIVSPKINRFSTRNIIEYAGFHPMNFYTGRTKSIGFYKTDSAEYHQAAETASVHGCAMMIAKYNFEKLSGLCEDYFLYYEEWDLSIRIKNAGLTCWYEPATTVYHLGGQSTGNNSLKEYYLARNRILFVRRHANPIQRFIFYLFFASVSTPINIMRLVARGRFAELKSFLKAIQWNLVYSSSPKCDLYTSKLC